MELINSLYEKTLIFALLKEPHFINVAFAIFLMVGFLVSLHILYKSFSYPFFPKRGTFADSINAVGSHNNKSGHKSFIIEFFSGLAMLGFVFMKSYLFLVGILFIIWVLAIGFTDFLLKRFGFRKK